MIPLGDAFPKELFPEGVLCTCRHEPPTVRRPSLRMLKGKYILLRPAEQRDARSIFKWLVFSDLTASMIGPPLFPEATLPTWEQFYSDYQPHFFDGTDEEKGRSFIIELDGRSIGHINYDRLDLTRRQAELDIWMRSSKYCGHGYGSDAINVLVSFLQSKYNVEQFILRPSLRNPRAIRAYERAGFVKVCMSYEEQARLYGKGDYLDDVLMIKSGAA